MKTTLALFLGILTTIVPGVSQEVPPQDGAALMFGSLASKTPKNVMDAIYKLSGLEVASNKTQFQFKDDELTAEFPFDVLVYPMDLNHDGAAEYCVVFGNSAFSGAAGSSFWVFTRRPDQSYEINFGFPGIFAAIPDPDTEYDAIVIAGPGMEFPLWSWNGEAYEFERNITESEMVESNAKYAAELSKAYLNELK